MKILFYIMDKNMDTNIQINKLGYKENLNILFISLPTSIKVSSETTRKYPKSHKNIR